MLACFFIMMMNNNFKGNDQTQKAFTALAKDDILQPILSVNDFTLNFFNATDCYQ